MTSFSVPVTGSLDVRLPRRSGWALALLLGCVFVANAQQQGADVDVKYSDLYRDLVFSEKGDEWREPEPEPYAWREAPEPPPRQRFSGGYDPEFEAMREAQYFRGNDSRNQQNDPQPTSLLRWEFR